MRQCAGIVIGWAKLIASVIGISIHAVMTGVAPFDLSPSAQKGRHYCFLGLIFSPLDEALILVLPSILLPHIQCSTVDHVSAIASIVFVMQHYTANTPALHS